MTDVLEDKGFVEVCLVVVVNAYSGAAEVTRYISTHPLVTPPVIVGGYPANQFILPRIKGNLTITRDMSNQITGKITTTVGDIEIDNGDGELDSWINDGWDGRDITIIAGTPNSSLVSFEDIFIGKVDRLEAPDDRTLVLKVKDRILELDVPVQDTLFTTGAHINKPVPVNIGRPVQVTPLLIDSDYDIYQHHDDEIYNVINVWDGLVALDYETDDLDGAINSTTGTITLTDASSFSANGIIRIEDEYVTYTSKSSNDLLGCTRGYATSVTASHADAVAVTGSDYIRDNNNGKFVLGGVPAFNITATIQGAVTTSGAWISEPDEIMEYLTVQRGPLATGDLDSAAFTALASAAPYDMGLYITDETTILDACDQVMDSVGGWYGFSRDGNLTVGILEAPSGTANYTFDETDTIGDMEIEFIDLPRWRSKLNYQRCWTVQDATQLADSVPASSVSYVSQEYRVVIDTDSSVQTKFLNALDADAEISLLHALSNAQTEVERRQALWGEQRFIYTVKTFLKGLNLNIGDIVELTDDRYSLSSTKFVVIGIEELLLENQVILRLFK